MQAGAQIFNDSNIIQIDGTYSNLQLVNKGTVYTSVATLPWQTVPSGTYYWDIAIGNVSFNAKSPVFAIAGGTPAGISATSNSGNSWTITVMTPLGAGPVDWYVFDAATPVNSKLGFQVFDPNETLVFDGLTKYLKVVGNVLDLVPTTGSNGNTFPFTNSYAYPSKKLAVGSVLTPMNFGNTKYPEGTANLPGNTSCIAFGMGCWSSGVGAAYFDWIHTVLPRNGYRADVGSQHFQYASSWNSSVPFGLQQYGGLILDVTNY